jgi:Protein of unknown function (DUF3999)
MRRLEFTRECLVAVALIGSAFGLRAEEPSFRFSAPIDVKTSAAFVRLPLPATAYAHSLQPDLHDLRIVDAKGERVPFAILVPRADAVQASEQQRDAVLYPLPARRDANGGLTSPVEVVVEGERINVRKLGGAADGAAILDSPGWLFDLGERRPQDPVPTSLRLAWSGPDEFSAAYFFEMSDDLRAWRPGFSGQLMALAAATGALTQPTIALPPTPARFVRLVWTDAKAAPLLVGAKVVTATRGSVVLDPPTSIVVAPSAMPPGKTEPVTGSDRALHFDLGAALPLSQIDLQFGSGTHIAPVRLQGRSDADAPWRDLPSAVFYRIESQGAVGTSPPLALQTTLRYVRVIPDERAAALDPAQTRLAVQAPLASLVFASQGTAPFALLAGSRNASPSALPPTGLVPDLEAERPRFGNASLGAWIEVAAVARQMDAEQRRAAMRPLLLWGVLLVGVVFLGFMVWRLAVAGPKPGAGDPEA